MPEPDGSGVTLRVPLALEYLVIHAPGWPGGYNPMPQTLEAARQFVLEHGGTLRRRYVSKWENVHVR